LSALVVEVMKKDLIRSGRLDRFSSSAARYTSSIQTDPKIVREVVLVNSAHVLSLAKNRILEKHVARSLLLALRKVPEGIQLSDELEDVHASVEDYVNNVVGLEKGGMLNLAKSRNDQVATALRMALRNRLAQLGIEISELEATLARKAFVNSSMLMPGYTHLQRAQPVTVGHHLLAYAEMMFRSSERLLECYSRVNRCPMGAGALASSSFYTGREYVAELLGFGGLIENSLDAVSSRDFAIESIYICSQIMNDLSRLAEELILWTSSEFSFAEIADRFSSTSSMMPQKKNPVVPEIARARSAQVSGDLASSLGIVKALPLSYNLDLQELTANLWSAVEKTTDTVSVFSEVIETLTFKQANLSAATTGDESLFATEVADYLVQRHAIPFRTAHQRVGALVKNSKSRKVFSSLDQAQIRQFLGVPISQKQIRELTSPNKVLARRTSPGAPNPRLVKSASQKAIRSAQKYSDSFSKLRSRLKKAELALSREIDLAMKKITKVSGGEKTAS
jgi:argininosuccinate lyase